MNILWFNLAVDYEDPILAFGTKWINEISKKVDHISVITVRKGVINVRDNIDVYAIGSGSKIEKLFKFYKTLIFVLAKREYNVAFSHMNPIFSVLSYPLLHFKNIPIVTWFAHPSLTWKLKLSHIVSDYIVTSFPSAYPYKHDKKLKVIGQGIDTELFKPLWEPSEQNRYLLCIGRLSPVKDHFTLVKAVNILKDEMDKKNYKVLIIGKAPGVEGEKYLKILKDYISLHNLSNLIEIRPPVLYENLPYIYNKGILHVNLTPKGFGDKVALEAMACGIPSVTANSDFIDLLGKYKELLYFKYRDPFSLAAKIRKLMDMTPYERRIMGYYLRKRIIENHSLRSLSCKLFDIFEGLSKKNQS